MCWCCGGGCGVGAVSGGVGVGVVDGGIAGVDGVAAVIVFAGVDLGGFFFCNPVVVVDVFLFMLLMLLRTLMLTLLFGVM